MGDLLGGIPPLNIGAGALVALIVILILTGKLVTLRELRDAQSQRDKAMTLAETYQKATTEQGMALHKVLDAVETTNEIVVAIQAGLNRPLDKGPRR